MQFTSKQVVTMVACISAAVVLAPVGVMAAAGQLVNIADPVLDRKVRVGSGGTLQVESRAGAMSGAFNKQMEVSGFGFHKIGETVAPVRMALTEVSAATTGSDYAQWQFVLVAYVQTTGTSACGTTLTGYTKHVLRQFMVPPRDTRQLLFDGPPLMVPAGAAGKRSCVGFAIQEMGTGPDVRLLFGATGYTFS